MNLLFSNSHHHLPPSLELPTCNKDFDHSYTEGEEDKHIVEWEEGSLEENKNNLEMREGSIG